MYRAVDEPHGRCRRRGDHRVTESVFPGAAPRFQQSKAILHLPRKSQKPVYFPRFPPLIQNTPIPESGTAFPGMRSATCRMPACHSVNC